MLSAASYGIDDFFGVRIGEAIVVFIFGVVIDIMKMLHLIYTKCAFSRNQTSNADFVSVTEHSEIVR